MPTADEIFNQLEQKRLAMMARRYLRDIRRDAIIDMR
jgi:peptidyl-prolyl cis-trans isomerase SurA